MRVLRGVVYMTKSSGPRTEPWGPPQDDVYLEDRSVSHLTRMQRDDRYDLNHRRRLHRGNRELRAGTHARTGANVAFCPGTFHGCALIF